MNSLRRLLGKFIKMDKNDYHAWDKQKLIERIQQLESSITAKQQQTKQPKKEFDFSKHHTRFIALKFSYLGWNYNGLAYQTHETELPTVEETVLKALEKCKLIPSMNPNDFKFSRCGRTDKGVSAMNQVISLNVRSNLSSEEQKDPANDFKELNYIQTLNKLVPHDIRFKAVCLRPPKDFDARFSCQYRHYRYFFHKDDLDIELMRLAAKKYEGEHDFRNFCKIDGSKQIHNHVRTMLSSDIVAYNEEFYYFDLQGRAFLWHQVRCMVAILFLVGSKLEKPEIIDWLFDVTNNPRRPVYDMANDLPLVLYDCKYKNDVEWTTMQTQDRFAYAQWLESNLKHNISSVFYDYFLSVPAVADSRTVVNVGDGKRKPVGKYIELKNRQKLETVEAQNAKFKKRKLK
ncbi:pseudouridine synthase [Saccharomycopsis crataegensis]|uniref:Pseudouridine synthase n=1 Tax=Saccharomycopsis crataegensis TaxID=43959 RepID=A0AAV5QRF0_9ASCO|nr:pseudouridine synthase [Saccharomycopsis crataegensis]